MAVRDVVLVLTGADDATASAVVDELERRPVRPVVMDTGDFPERLRLTATLSPLGWAGSLTTADRDGVDLERVGAVYYRRPTRFRLRTGMSEADSVFAMAEARYGLGGVLASLDVRWVNEPGRIAVAEYKPLGLKVAAQCGLNVPPTLVTNDHGAATEFARQVDGPIVCKTLSSIAFSDDGPRPRQVWGMSDSASSHLIVRTGRVRGCSRGCGGGGRGRC